eukprot:805046_1
MSSTSPQTQQPNHPNGITILIHKLSYYSIAIALCLPCHSVTDPTPSTSAYTSAPCVSFIGIIIGFIIGFILVPFIGFIIGIIITKTMSCLIPSAPHHLIKAAAVAAAAIAYKPSNPLTHPCTANHHSISIAPDQYNTPYLSPTTMAETCSIDYTRNTNIIHCNIENHNIIEQD